MRHYSLAEAALLTGLPLASVRRALEDKVIPSRRVRLRKAVQRLISREGLLCLKLEQLGVGQLPLAHRRRIYQAVLAHPEALQVNDSEAVIIDVRKAKRELRDSLDRYQLAEAMVAEDPEIMAGSPVIQGTRVPVYLIAEMRRQGASISEILEGYPSLMQEQIEAAELYARAHPRRGPKTRTRLPRDTRLVFRKTYPLQRAS